MKVRELLRKRISANGAANMSRPPPTTMMVRIVPPNKSMKKKSAVRPRNDVSSKSLQYLAKKNIWKRKSKSATPRHNPKRRQQKSTIIYIWYTWKQKPNVLRTANTITVQAWNCKSVWMQENTKFSEVKEIRDESPDFKVFYDQLRIQIYVKWSNNLQTSSSYPSLEYNPRSSLVNKVIHSSCQKPPLITAHVWRTLGEIYEENHLMPVFIFWALPFYPETDRAIRSSYLSLPILKAHQARLCWCNETISQGQKRIFWSVYERRLFKELSESQQLP